MKGLELARDFWETCGKPVFEERFSDVMPLLAVGLVGSGSECYGFDDEISRDHDFEPGFCVFLPSEELVDRRTAFLLERAYDALPKAYNGFFRSRLHPAGGNRHGVMRTSDFYTAKTGYPGEPLTWRAWLSLPEYALAEAVNGEIFYDGLGEFSAIRTAWSRPPRDIQLKKLAGYLMAMSQAGEYNYARCLSHGESGAARLALSEFVRSAIGAALWSYSRPVPYYKWSFRTLRTVPEAVPLHGLLETILTGTQPEALLRESCREVLRLLQINGLTDGTEEDLQRTAFLLNDRIRNADLRNRNILAAV